MSTEIWLPDHGTVPIHMYEAANAVSDYDPDLVLGRNEATGTWQVFIKNGPHGGQPFPVFDLGRELPSYTQIQKKLYNADVRRHGHKIVEQMQRRVDAKKAALDKEGLDVAGETAEFIEWGMRDLGMLPKLRIFVPSEKGK